MKPKSLQKTIIVLCTASLFFLSCFLLMPYPFSFLAKDLERPEYISSAWPPPKSEIWIGYYNLSLLRSMPFNRGISVTLEPMSIVYLEFPRADARHISPFIDRVYLYIDGAQIPNSGRYYLDNATAIIQGTVDKPIYYDVSAQYSISWTPELSKGNHVAQLTIETESGETLEYEWHFRIK